MNPQILKIINEPGINFKIRRALLRLMGIEEPQLSDLVPNKELPGDY